MDRRQWMTTAAAGGLVASATNLIDLSKSSGASPLPIETSSNVPKADVDWPVWDDAERDGIQGVLDSGKWGRTTGGKNAVAFEKEFAKRMQAKFCVATSSGTTALLTALGALNVGPGDEVIIPPYTFVATFNAITNSFALPIFADVDRQTFQIDPAAIKAQVTDNTKVIMPVHLGGCVADLDSIRAIAKDKNLAIVEDACQAPMAEWQGRPVGTFGAAGCFSFQASKNITAGEGGAVITDDQDIANLCYDFHTPGGAKRSPSVGRGANFRMTEFQSALLVAQLTRQVEQSQKRDENARNLSRLLTEIPGITPVQLVNGCTRSAWHLYMFRYDSKAFGGKSRAEFLKTLTAAGVPASGGYSRLHKSPHVEALAANPHYQRIYGTDFMKRWLEKNACPQNDLLCEEAVWLPQTQLLGTNESIQQIADAIRTVQKQLS